MLPADNPFVLRVLIVSLETLNTYTNPFVIVAPNYRKLHCIKEFPPQPNFPGPFNRLNSYTKKNWPLAVFAKGQWPVLWLVLLSALCFCRFSLYTPSKIKHHLPLA